MLSYHRLRGFGEVGFLTKPRGAKTPHHEFLMNLVKAFRGSVGWMGRSFDVVVSTGSNFCLLPSVLAWVRGIPIVNVESSIRFTQPSKTARMLHPISTLTALQWEEQKRLLKGGWVVGPILPKRELEPWNGGYILVTGGTLGHKRLFDAISQTSLRNVVLQTGRVDPKPYMERHPEWRVIQYSTRFHELVAGAEVVVTHFGSTALEALVYEKPIVMVLNPEWKRTVGREDAQHFARKVNAVFVEEATRENLLRAIEEARRKPTPKLPDGAEALANLILRL